MSFNIISRITQSYLSFSKHKHGLCTVSGCINHLKDFCTHCHFFVFSSYKNVLEYNLDFQNVPTYCLRIWDFPPIVFEWAPGGGQLNFWPFQNKAKSSTSKNTCTQVKMQKKMLSEETSLAKTSGYGALFFDLNILIFLTF